MRFTFVTLFSQLIEGYFSDSILRRAIDAELIEVEFVNPRDFSTNKFLKVDDYQVGGGAGLVLEPLALSLALDSIKRQNPKTHIIFLTPCAKTFLQNDAKRLSQREHITLVCGRYEGFDERLIELYADEVFSIGDFILTGGELAALCLCDSIARQVGGVLGNQDSLLGESYEKYLLEAPNFVKPHRFKNLTIPSEYSKGNHARIADLKLKAAEAKTKFHRPDLYVRYKQGLNDEK
ncbi:tRNA (guanosine(37)-N1)-methyltransferase TrmD [Helicobacter winghamensis]|uniref:tRNA (guanine-N(1)-)-methyltransferase n=2 Tax=Helicobacter winghamensis TaxID=157268 RepID=A0A2N3PLB9_9HELI|nr:tRNA (guanosine(37)-N1)-methyltransferase TrmD [Helicobacter winghamensis]EEO25769.1 tRNA (guanine-N(1)-)-methyltransferase [Helicobacter winghamensis ATCC BAA-430]PKT75076.1 tRNA (guanosine(37)-N1)-methyltransferase TrmD [Helicobacter winghamensis]PKT79358.1 tRNA (guanosine(37)-N1)-methyltransferase TrmD [Helicobacter winghamensis]PKT79572.1 tRNA (guanosine(37)-N1)-methyltransferase TrmD [Helicobacter winghamensis]PKT82592.1 tRNA (guanosine(37)-N1)-methyltransferase TrmD [Helicobacter wing